VLRAERLEWRSGSLKSARCVAIYSRASDVRRPKRNLLVFVDAPLSLDNTLSYLGLLPSVRMRPSGSAARSYNRRWGIWSPSRPACLYFRHCPPLQRAWMQSRVACAQPAPLSARSGTSCRRKSPILGSRFIIDNYVSRSFLRQHARPQRSRQTSPSILGL
jgi:hypothetical protein